MALRSASRDTSVENLEALWLKKAGMRSDLTVTVGSQSFSVHKFPLYSRSDYFPEIAEDDPKTGRTHINLSGLPGGPENFKLIASFCYGIDFEITPINVAALRCAADYLVMSDDSRRGMGKIGNLKSLTESHLKNFLSLWENSLAILRTCGEFFPIAENIGLINRAISSIAEHALRSHKLSNEAIHLSDSVINLRLDLFLPLLEEFKKSELSDTEIAKIIEMYGRKWIPDISDLTLDFDPKDTKIFKYRKILEALVDSLPLTLGSNAMKTLLRFLRISIFLNVSKEIKNVLHRRAGELFDQANLEDLLLLEVNDVHGLITGFASEEHLNSLSNKTASLQVASKLIDGFLYTMAAHPDIYTITFSEFLNLMQVLPHESRSSHDDLYKAVEKFVQSQSSSLSEIETMSLTSLINPHLLSLEICEAVSSQRALPLSFLIQILKIQKNTLKTKAEEVRKVERKFESEEDKIRREREALMARIKEIKTQISASEASFEIIKVAMQEDKDALRKEVAANEKLAHDLEREIKQVKMIMGKRSFFRMF